MLKKKTHRETKTYRDTDREAERQIKEHRGNKSERDRHATDKDLSQFFSHTLIAVSSLLHDCNRRTRNRPRPHI